MDIYINRKTNKKRYKSTTFRGMWAVTTIFSNYQRQGKDNAFGTNIIFGYYLFHKRQS